MLYGRGEIVGDHIENRGKNKEGKTKYRVVIEVGTGKRDKITRNIIGTKPQAEALRDDLRAKLKEGWDPKAPKTDLYHYLLKWLDYNKENLEYKSFVRYEGIIKNHIKDSIGGIRLDKLTPIMIQDQYLKWAKTLAHNTIRKHHNMLHKAMRQAVKWKLASYNPVDMVDPPSLTKYEAKVLPNGEAIVEFQESFKPGTTLYLPVMISTTGSLRRGEVCGLQWQDMEWDTGRVWVKRSLQRVKGKGLQPKPYTKNDKIRSVVLPPTVVELLKQEYMTRYNGDALGLHDDNYICLNTKGRPVAPDLITHTFEKLNLPITFHGCRHSHDTLLFRHHVDTKLVADRAGRDEGLTRRTYEHVIPDMQEEIAQLIEDILFKKPIGDNPATDEKKEEKNDKEKSLQ